MQIINKVGQYRQSGRDWYNRANNNIAEIRKIVVHHTASRQVDDDSKALQTAYQHHVNNGWVGLSYHFFIPKSGNIYQINDLIEVTWHDTVNWDSIGICLDGYFHPDINEKPTDAQIKSLRWLLDKLCTQHPEFPATFKDVLSHRNRSSTACCGNELYPKIDEYRTMGGNVAWGKDNADSFGNLVKKSTQWDKTCEEYNLGDPIHTMFESLKSYVAGLKSQITDLRNKYLQADAEVKNREEQVSRLKDQVTDEQKLRKDLTDSLADTRAEVSRVTTVYEDRISVLQGQVDNASKAKGELNQTIAERDSEILKLQDKIKEYQKGYVDKFDLGALVSAVVSWVRTRLNKSEQS